MEIYSDFNQLIYAIRSIEMYAPWVRHIYIVTNGQIPYWLNLNQSYVSVVTHQQIFKNKVLTRIGTGSPENDSAPIPGTLSTTSG